MSELTKVISKVLKVNPRNIKDATSPMNVKSWDSFRGLLLITEIEKVFHIKFSMEEMLSIKDVGSIKTVLKKHGIKLDD